MRISDWSSDVCSSDLVRNGMPALAAAVDNLFAQVRSNLDNVHVMALYDPVTALPNRIHFKREADRLLKARGPGARGSEVRRVGQACVSTCRSRGSQEA